MIHGPGCPVCVLPIGRVDQAIRLARERGVILCTMPTRCACRLRQTLADARQGRWCEVRMIYSTQDALASRATIRTARWVFFAIGFETTTRPTAVAVKQAKAAGLKNFSILCNHVLTRRPCTRSWQ